jgi:hypothetical protein
MLSMQTGTELVAGGAAPKRRVFAWMANIDCPNCIGTKQNQFRTKPAIDFQDSSKL